MAGRWAAGRARHAPVLLIRPKHAGQPCKARGRAAWAGSPGDGGAALPLSLLHLFTQGDPRPVPAPLPADVGLHQVFKYTPTGKQLLALGTRGQRGDSATKFCKPTQVSGTAGAVDAISRADAECRLRLCIHCRRVDSWVPQRRLDGTRARRCRRFSPHRRCLPRATAASSCQTATATAGWRSLMQMAPGCKTTACRRRPRYPSLLPTGGTRVKWVGGRGRNGWNSRALCVIFLSFRSLPAFLAAPHMASPSAALRDACVSPAYSAH